MTTVNDIMEMINEIMDDPALQKNIKMKLEKITNELRSAKEQDIRLRADKCMDELDEICNDSNIQPFVRTQVLSIVSMLESLD